MEINALRLIGHARCMLRYEQLTVLQTMRLNVKQPVLDCEGKPLMVNQTNADGSLVIGEDHRPVQVPETLRSYLVLALNNKAQTESEPIGRSKRPSATNYPRSCMRRTTS